jgi:hypothetical protein
MGLEWPSLEIKGICREFWEIDIDCELVGGGGGGGGDGG